MIGAPNPPPQATLDECIVPTLDRTGRKIRYLGKQGAVLSGKLAKNHLSAINNPLNSIRPNAPGNAISLIMKDFKLAMVVAAEVVHIELAEKVKEVYEKTGRYIPARFLGRLKVSA